MQKSRKLKKEREQKGILIVEFYRDKKEIRG